jgi:hypothetical protein
VCREAPLAADSRAACRGGRAVEQHLTGEARLRGPQHGMVLRYLDWRRRAIGLRPVEAGVAGENAVPKRSVSTIRVTGMKRFAANRGLNVVRVRVGERGLSIVGKDPAARQAGFCGNPVCASSGQTGRSGTAGFSRGAVSM